MRKNNIAVMQANLLERSIYQNGYSAYIPWSQSIGFKVHSLRQQEHTQPILAEDFLVNSGFTRNNMENEYSIRAFLEPSGTIMLSYANQEDNSQLEKLNLPDSAPLKLPLDKVLNARRSVRHYTGDKIPLIYLATILRAACGITASNEVDIGNGAATSINFRTAGSAGGIYPIDLFITALNVEGLDRAIYQYNAAEDCLVKLFDSDCVNRLLQSFSISDEHISINKAGFIILLTGSAPKSMRKYGNQGLSFTLQEVGSISQNIHLAVTALGLGSVDCASYYIDEMHHALNMDGVYKHLFHTIIIGVNQ